MSEPPSVRDPQRSRWSEEDLGLLRALGGFLSRIIHGDDVDMPDLSRRDELGILANMVARLARELRATRREERERRAELTGRVAELQAAYDTQEKLLVAQRGAIPPILEPYPRVLLVPLAGDLDIGRATYLIAALLDRVAATRVEAVLLHRALPEPLSAEAAALVLRVAQVLVHAGARPLLSGIPAPVPAPLVPLAPCKSLHDALTTALDLVGVRITR